MKKLILVLTVVTLAAFLLVGCFGVTPEEDVVVTTAAIPGVTAPVTGATPVPAITATAQYTGVVTWLPADTTFAAATAYTATITLTEKAGYTLTGVAADYFTVTGATATNAADSGVVTAVFPATAAEPVIGLTGIAVLPKTMDLVVGGSDTITSVTATYEIKGTDVPIALGDCTYASSPTGIVTVDAGLVTAVAEGTATITVSYGGETDTLVVTVSVVPVTGVTLDKATMTLTAGGTTGILAETVLPTDATDLSVTWASSAPAVAAVAGGVVTPLTAGTATITVTTVDGDFTAKCVVTVVPKVLTSIVVDPKTMAFSSATGSKTITSVTAHYSDGTTAEIDLDDEDIAITSSDIDEDFVTVVDGVVTAVGFGEATITVSYTEEDTTRNVYYVEATDTIAVTVIGKVHNVTKDKYYDTIKDAIDAAVDYDTIEVAAGTYAQAAVTLQIDVEGLTLKSIVGADTTIIDFTNPTSGGGGACIAIVNPYVTVEGFTVKHTVTEEIVGIWLGEANDEASTGNNNATVTGNKLYNATIYLDSGSHSMISDNTFPDKGGINIDANNSYVTITGNSISSANICLMGPGTAGTGIFDNILITDNTVSKNNYSGGGIIFSNGVGPTTITNSTIMGNNITENLHGGISIASGVTWGDNNVINGNNIVDNVNFGIKMEGTGTVDATNNWWGDASGPTHSANPGGTGDVVIGDVGYVPFSTVEY